MSDEERRQVEQARSADTDRIFTLPNMLSFFRLALIPVIVCLYEADMFWWAFAMLGLSAATDIVDGWIARTFHLVSDFGKAIDPIADKLTQAAVLLCLLPMRYWWVIGVMAFKEITIGILTYMTLKRTHNVYSAGWYGKLCTVVIYLSMALLILWEVIAGEPASETFLLCDTLLISALILLSFTKYFIYFTRILRTVPRDAREAT